MISICNISSCPYLAPEVISLFTFTVFESNQSISLNWANTFRLNGPLLNFIVIRDGIFLLIGTQTFAVFPNQPTDTSEYIHTYVCDIMILH